MSNAIATTQNGALTMLDSERIDLLRRTLVQDISPAEFELYIAVCNRTGLDPFAKQIYAIKRSGKMVIQVSIDGMRLIAQRSQDYGGQDGPYWCGEDGQWTDVWLRSEHPVAAKVGVKRRGWSNYVYAVAHWDEYVVSYQGKPSQFWASMPRLMLAKCAESLALRKAFPQELSGLYTSAEMGQAQNDVAESNDPHAPLHALTDVITDDGEIVSRTSLGEQAFNATPDQIKRIFAAGEEHGWTKDEIRNQMDFAFSKQSTRDLTIAEATELIETIEGRAVPIDAQPALV